MSTLKDKLLNKGIECSDLDDVVHGAASSLASNTNNGGLDEQINFLGSICGWSDEDIEKAI